jgi:cation-transporting ATPase V
LSAIAEAQHSPAAAPPANAPRTADTGNGGIVGKVVGGLARTLLGLRADVRDGPPEIERLRDALDGIGYHLDSVTAATQPSPREEARRGIRAWLQRVWLDWPFGLAASGLTMFFGAYPWAGWLAFAATVPVQFIVGWPFLLGAAQRARERTANMDTLIALGTLTAFSYSTYQLFVGGTRSRG